jgi:hypothetical protein
MVPTVRPADLALPRGRLGDVHEEVPVTGTRFGLVGGGMIARRHVWPLAAFDGVLWRPSPTPRRAGASARGQVD